MEFNAQSEEEVARANLLPKAEYDFEVAIAEDTTSKKTGAAMIKLGVILYSGEGAQRKVTDYLMAAMAAKLRHFCDATGLLPQYQRGSLCAADCEGRTGRCKVIIREDKTGQYPPKNEIADYCTRPAKSPSATPASAPTTGDDNLPF